MRQHQCERCGGDFMGRTNAKFCFIRCGAIKHSPSFVMQARELWHAGKTMKEVAAEMGVGRNVIAGIINRNDFASRPSPIRR